MTVTVRGTPTSGNGAAATPTSFATTFSATPDDDDIAVIIGHISAGTITMSLPAGWDPVDGVTNPTSQGSNSRVNMWWKRLTAGEAAPTITNSGNATGGWESHLLAGASLGATPVRGLVASTAAVTSRALPSLTGCAAGSLLIAGASARVASGTIPSGITPNASYSETVDHATSRTTAGQNIRMETATRDVTTAGTFGGESFSVTNAISSSMITWLIEVLEEPTNIPVADSDAPTVTDADEPIEQTQTDTATVTDGQTQDQSNTDTATFTDAETLSLSDADGFTATDAQTTPTATFTQADTLAVTDAESQSLADADTTAVGDAESHAQTQTDVATATDAEALAQSSTDTLTVSDAEALAVAASDVDSLVFTDAEDLDDGTADKASTDTLTFTETESIQLADAETLAVLDAELTAMASADTLSLVDDHTLELADDDTAGVVDDEVLPDASLADADSFTVFESQDIDDGAVTPADVTVVLDVPVVTVVLGEPDAMSTIVTGTSGVTIDVPTEQQVQLDIADAEVTIR